MASDTPKKPRQLGSRPSGSGGRTPFTTPNSNSSPFWTQEHSVLILKIVALFVCILSFFIFSEYLLSIDVVKETPTDRVGIPCRRYHVAAIVTDDFDCSTLTRRCLLNKDNDIFTCAAQTLECLSPQRGKLLAGDDLHHEVSLVFARICSVDGRSCAEDPIKELHGKIVSNSGVSPHETALALLKEAGEFESQSPNFQFTPHHSFPLSDQHFFMPPEMVAHMSTFKATLVPGRSLKRPIISVSIKNNTDDLLYAKYTRNFNDALIELGNVSSTPFANGSLFLVSPTNTVLFQALSYGIERVLSECGKGREESSKEELCQDEKLLLIALQATACAMRKANQEDSNKAAAGDCDTTLNGLVPLRNCQHNLQLVVTTKKPTKAKIIERLPLDVLLLSTSREMDCADLQKRNPRRKAEASKEQLLSPIIIVDNRAPRRYSLIVSASAMGPRNFEGILTTTLRLLVGRPTRESVIDPVAFVGLDTGKVECEEGLSKSVRSTLSSAGFPCNPLNKKGSHHKRRVAVVKFDHQAGRFYTFVDQRTASSDYAVGY